MSAIGVIYMARGLDSNWRARVTRFIASYLRHPAGIDHQLYVILKELAEPADWHWTKDQFAPLQPVIIDDPSSSVGNGAFLKACKYVDEPAVCMLASSAEIMHDNWLVKLYDVLNLPNVGLVGCCGSSAFIPYWFPELAYPNLHIRTPTFMIWRSLFQEIAGPFDFSSKQNDCAFEHGPNSMTHQVLAAGKKALVVETERVIEPDAWGDTTYRNNLQNVLIHDRGARDYHDL